jgi:hypothetical protein
VSEKPRERGSGRERSSTFGFGGGCCHGGEGGVDEGEAQAVTRWQRRRFLSVQRPSRSCSRVCHWDFGGHDEPWLACPHPHLSFYVALRDEGTQS